MDIVLKEAEVRKYIVEGLCRQGLEAEAEGLHIRLVGDENGDEFVVEARNVVISVQAPRIEAAPVKKGILPLTGRRIDIKDKEPDKDDGVPMTSLLEESSSIRTNKGINPRADGAALGARVFTSFDEIGVDPNVVSNDELYPGDNPNRKT